MMDQVIHFTSAALNQGRIVQHLIEDRIIPALSPARRTFALYLSRQIEHGKIFNEPFQRDLQAFISMISQTVADGTFVGWEADEHHVHGGFDIICLDSCAKKLGPTVDELWHFWSAITQVLDAIKAIAVVSELTSN